MTEPASPLAAFRDAALVWASGGRGQELVTAAAVALGDGVDSPSLRVLAGATRSSADLEALEVAPAAFSELGFTIAARRSAPAIIAGARVRAAKFLAHGAKTPRTLARDLYLMWVEADYTDELAPWAGFDDTYALIDDGTISDSLGDLDASVAQAARDLAERPA